MATVCCELNPNTLASVRQLRDRASKAADDGVVWPSSLFVVLDDLESRARQILKNGQGGEKRCAQKCSSYFRGLQLMNSLIIQ